MNSAAFTPVTRVLKRLERQSANAKFWAFNSQFAERSGMPSEAERWGRWAVAATYRAAKLRRLVAKVARGLQ